MRIFCLSIVIYLFTLCSAHAQNNEKVKLLNKEIERIENEILIKTDSLKKLKNEVKFIENQMFLSNFSNQDSTPPVFATIKIKGILRETESTLSKDITTLLKNDTVRLLDYFNGYWIVTKSVYSGYLSEVLINETELTNAYKENWQIRNEILETENEAKKVKETEKSNAERAKKFRMEQEKHKQKIITKYGVEIGQKILNKYYWIGMSSEMARESLGNPVDINRTVGTWGAHEQWVYGKVYLYFENGILTSYQN